MISLLLPYMCESLKVCLNAESLENDKEGKKNGEIKAVVANLYGVSVPPQSGQGLFEAFVSSCTLYIYIYI